MPASSRLAHRWAAVEAPPKWKSVVKVIDTMQEALGMPAVSLVELNDEGDATGWKQDALEAAMRKYDVLVFHGSYWHVTNDGSETEDAMAREFSGFLDRCKTTKTKVVYMLHSTVYQIVAKRQHEMQWVNHAAALADAHQGVFFACSTDRECADVWGFHFTPIPLLFPHAFRPRDALPSPVKDVDDQGLGMPDARYDEINFGLFATSGGFFKNNPIAVLAILRWLAKHPEKSAHAFVTEETRFLLNKRFKAKSERPTTLLNMGAGVANADIFNNGRFRFTTLKYISDHATFQDKLSGMHVVLCTSLSESFGLGAFDAMCAGVPAVCSAQTPATSLLSPQARKTLTVEQPTSVAEIADAIDRALSVYSSVEARNELRKEMERGVPGWNETCAAQLLSLEMV